MSFPQIPLPALDEIKKHFNLFDYIDGERIAPTVPLNAWVTNPNTGEQIAPQMATSPENLERALSVAQRLHESGAWANTAPEKRADILDAAAMHLMNLVPMIAGVESYNTGIVFSTTSFVNAIVWLAFKAAAGILRSGYAVSKVPGPHGDVEVLRKPLGGAVAIVPLNSPAALAAHKVATAPSAGSRTSCPGAIPSARGSSSTARSRSRTPVR